MACFTESLFNEISCSQSFLEDQYRKFLQKPNEGRKTQNQCNKVKQNNLKCQRNQPETETSNDFFENRELLTPCPLAKNSSAIWSWYLESDPTCSRAFLNWEFYGNKNSTIGKNNHEQYVEWMASPGRQDGDFLSIRSLKQSVMREQMACQAELKKLAMGKRKGIYLQFCENIPDSVTHILREQMETLVQQLPTVYVKDTEFDCKQMLVRYDSNTACKLQHYISGQPTRLFPSESVEGVEPLLTQRYFKGHPLIITRNPARFNEVAKSLSSQSMPWEKGDVMEYVNKLRPFLDTGTVVAEKSGIGSDDGSSEPKTICLASFDTFIILASCLFVSDFDVSIPFSKKHDPGTHKIILQFKDPLFMRGYPQRLHFQKAFKPLFDSYHYSKLSQHSCSKRKLPISYGMCAPKECDGPSRKGYDEGVRYSENDKSSNLLVFDVTERRQDALVTLHDISENNSSKLFLILGHYSPIMLETATRECLVFHVFKMELQPEFGLEDLHVDEVLKIGWLFMLYPRCKVILIRVSYDGRNVIDVSDIDEKDFRLISINKYNLDMHVCLSKLLQLMTKLTKLQTDAEYFIRSTPQTTKCEVFIQSNLSTAPDITQRELVSFGVEVQKNCPRLLCAQTPAWIPIDVSKLTPFHWLTKHIPCTFPIRPPSCNRGKRGSVGGNTTERGGSRCHGYLGATKQGQTDSASPRGLASKKKKKKKKGANRGQNTATSVD